MLKDNEQAGEGACAKKIMRRKGGHDKQQKIRSYPPEFRRRAVMMHVEGGHSQCEVARQLEVRRGRTQPVRGGAPVGSAAD